MTLVVRNPATDAVPEGKSLVGHTVAEVSLSESATRALQRDAM